MRVVHVIGSLETGGAERVLVRLATARGPVEHQVVTLHAGGALEVVLREAGIPLHTVPFRMRAARRGVAALRELLGTLRPDVVSAWMHHANIAATLAAPAGVPVVWGIRTMAAPHREQPITGAVMLASAFWARRPSRIVYNSLAAATTHERMGYPRDRRMVIANGFAPADFTATRDEAAAWRAATGIPAGVPLVVQLGRLHPVKGHRFLLEALIGDVLPPPWHLAVVGRPDGVTPAMLHEDAARAGLTGRFHVVPQCGEVRLPLTAADLVVVPSRWGESFPNAVAEAMAAGRPVLAADLGDAGRIVDDPAWIVPAGDRGAWRRRLAEVARTPAPALRAVGARNRNRIATTFTLERFRDAYHETLRSAAG